jgi:hypothetical protein
LRSIGRVIDELNRRAIVHIVRASAARPELVETAV